MTTPGIAALCDLSGAPVTAGDCRAIGLAPDSTSFAGTVCDPRLPARVDSLRTPDRITLLLGQPGPSDHQDDDPGVLGGATGAARMRHLLDRHGAELPARLAGEWTLLDWQPGRLRLVQSLARRDSLFVARSADRVAVGPDLDRLAGLDWIGRDLDPLGLAGALGRGALRSALDRRTVLPQVERLAPGECLVLEPGRTRRSACVLPEPEPWGGTFAEAIALVDRLLGQILEERIAAHASTAVMLSGGLDSSVLAVLLAEAMPAGQPLIALTSAAAPGSGLADEWAPASMVARHLGLAQVPVVPDPAASPYHPDPEAFRLAGGPTLSPRHYLYRAMAQAAVDQGAAELFDGAYGELTLTGYLPLATGRDRFRQGLKALLRPSAPAATGPWHVRLARHRGAALAEVAGRFAAGAAGPGHQRRPGAACGYVTGHEKALLVPTLLDHGIRGELPFRDPRLLRLFAGFPADYLIRNGLDRAPARAMMAGRLPEAIRLRRTTGAFSPDYLLRIRDHAAAARCRLTVWRRAEADDWLDLDWLDGALQAIGSRGPASIAQAFEVQLTAMAAEYLTWWRRAE